MASNADIAEKDHLWMGTNELFNASRFSLPSSFCELRRDRSVFVLRTTPRQVRLRSMSYAETSQGREIFELGLGFR